MSKAKCQCGKEAIYFKTRGKSEALCRDCAEFIKRMLKVR